MPVPHVPDALKALEDIGKKFYKERSVDLPGDHSCALAPLGAAMEAKANARVQEFRAVHFLKAVKVEQLAYAIVGVDKHRFERPTKSDGTFDEAAFEAQADAKRSILNGWPEGIITFLFNELCLLQDEVEAMVGEEVQTEAPSEEEAAAAEAEAAAATETETEAGAETAEPEAPAADEPPAA